MTIWRRIFEEQKRILLPLAIAIVANVAVLALAVLPLRTAVASANARAIDTLRELAEARRLDRQVTLERTSKERADEELRKFHTEVLPRDFATAETTANLWLTRAAEDAGLSFKGSHFDWDAVRDSRLTRGVSRVTLEGRYPNIRRFLYAVETAREFLIVEKVELAEQSDQPAANGRLQVSLVVSTYFLTPPAR